MKYPNTKQASEKKGRELLLEMSPAPTQTSICRTVTLGVSMSGRARSSSCRTCQGWQLRGVPCNFVRECERAAVLWLRGITCTTKRILKTCFSFSGSDELIPSSLQYYFHANDKLSVASSSVSNTLSPKTEPHRRMCTFSTGIFHDDSSYCPRIPLEYTGCMRTLAVNTTSCPGIMRMFPSYNPCTVVTQGHETALGKSCRNCRVEIDYNVWYLAQECISSCVLNLRNVRSNLFVTQHIASVLSANPRKRDGASPAMQRLCFATS